MVRFSASNQGLILLLVADLLRACGKARGHLPGLDLALRTVPRERRRARDQATRWVAFL